MYSPITFGTLLAKYNHPDWRYRLVHDENEIFTEWVRSKRELHPTEEAALPRDDAGRQYRTFNGRYLVRLSTVTGLGVSVRVPEAIRIRAEFRPVLSMLTARQRERFYLSRSRFLRRRNIARLAYSHEGGMPGRHMNWRLTQLDAIKDEWIVKYLKHLGRVAFDQHIERACELKAADHERFHYIGYCIYLGKTDQQIAAMYLLHPSVIKAVRMLYYDFTRFPKDIIARRTYFRQLVVSGVYSETEFQQYKLIDDMGESGLKSLITPHLMPPDEQTKVEQYLASSMLENVLRLKMAVRNQRDSLNYNNVINMLGTFYIKKAELGLTHSKIKNLDTNTRKVETDMGNMVKGGHEHEKLFDTLKHMTGSIRQISLLENDAPKFRSIDELK